MRDDRWILMKSSLGVSQPRYVVLARELRALVSNLKEHETLPSERDLAVSYGVSRETVRKAIALAEDEGLLYSGHGRGTYAKDDSVRKASQHKFSFSKEAEVRGCKPGQRIISIQRCAPSPEAADALQLPSDATVLQIVRVRLFDRTVIGLQVTFLNIPAEQTITKRELVKAGSLYELLQEKFQYVFNDAIDEIAVGLASAQEAALLEVNVGAPLIILKRTLFTERRHRLEFSDMKFTQTYHYISRVVLSGPR